MNEKALLKGWRHVKLRDLLATLESGLRPKGGVGGLQDGVPSIGAEHLNNDGGFVLGNLRYIPHDFYATMRRGRIQVGDILVVKDGATTGKVSLVPHNWPFDESAVNEHVFILRPSKDALAEYLFFYLYSPAGQHDIKRNFHGSAQGGINQTFAEHLIIPLPPLPVQERIVEILQKADEIRRKRKEALELADKILPALFLEMFGDPATNPKGYEKATIGTVAFMVTSGYTPRGGARNYVSDGPLLLRSQNIKMLSLDLSDCAHLPEAIFNDMERVHVQLGDVLMNITGKGTAGRVTWAADPTLRAAVNQHVCIIRCNQERILAPFLAIQLSMPYYQAIIEGAPGSTQTGFNHSRVRGLEIIIPPIPAQSSFVAQVAALTEAKLKLRTACEDAENLFSSLMQQAFTGELTADWEAANAEWIAEQQAFYERLPRLFVLALIAEKAKRTGRSAEVLVTALMKYVFLYQMEGNSNHRRFYHFVPYHYGPFARELYADLRKLEEAGLIVVHQDPEEEKTRICLADRAKVEQALAELPEDIKEDVGTIIATYGELDHSGLLETVYEKYPTYAKKSRLRRGSGGKGRE